MKLNLKSKKPNSFKRGLFGSRKKQEKLILLNKEEKKEKEFDDAESYSPSMFQQAPSLILLLVVIALITAAGSVGLQSFQDSQTANSFAANISGQGLTSLDNFAIQLPTVGTMVGVGLILAVVIGVFAFFARRG